MTNATSLQAIHAIEVLLEPNGEPVVYAGTDAGLFLSRDSGRSWSDALAGSAVGGGLPVTALAARRRPGGPALLLAGSRGGIFRLDGGNAGWEGVPFGRPAPVITAFCALPAGSLHAAALQDGVFTSTDEGRSWARWNFGLLDWHVYALAAACLADGTPVLMAGTDSGIYASRNQGRSWRETGFPDAAGAVLALAAAGGQSDVFAGTESGCIYRSTDGGTSWTEVYRDPGGEEITCLAAGSAGDGVAGCAASCAGQVIATRDGGQHWQVWREAAPGAMVTALAAPQRLEQGARLWGATSIGEVFQISVA